MLKAVGLETPSLTQDLLSGDVLEDVYQFEHRVKWTTGALFGGKQFKYGSNFYWLIFSTAYQLGLKQYVY